MLLDTTHEIGTPEGVELRLPLAGLAPRALAWLIDAAIKAGVLFTASVVLGVLGGLGFGLLLLVNFVVWWLYNVLFEVLWHGTTPGKRQFGLAVANLNGTPVGWSGSIIRNLLRVVDILPGAYTFGCISVLVSSKYQRLGDLAAGTIVVYRTPATPLPTLDAAPVPLDVPLSRDEQLAIVEFGERSPGLNPARAEELACVLAPVLDGIDAARLRAHASWLVGGARE